jgi:hypothetical protein
VTEKNYDSVVDISNLIKIMFLIAPHFPIRIQQKVCFIRPIKLSLFQVNKGNNKITELRTILQRESKSSVVGGANLT